jgi:hypothetical protein
MRSDKIIKGMVAVAVIGAALFGLNKWATRDRSQVTQLKNSLMKSNASGVEAFQRGVEQGKAAAATPAPAVSPLESWVTERAKQNYLLADVERVTINPDASTEAEDDRVVLVNLTFIGAKFSKDGLQDLLTEYADDLAAGMAAEFPEVTQIAVFWSAPKMGGYSGKNAYTCRDGYAYIEDVIY